MGIETVYCKPKTLSLTVAREKREFLSKKVLKG
jgi:hypothetical protein